MVFLFALAAPTEPMSPKNTARHNRRPAAAADSTGSEVGVQSSTMLTGRAPGLWLDMAKTARTIASELFDPNEPPTTTACWPLRLQRSDDIR